MRIVTVSALTPATILHEMLCRSSHTCSPQYKHKEIVSTYVAFSSQMTRTRCPRMTDKLASGAIISDLVIAAVIRTMMQMVEKAMSTCLLLRCCLNKNHATARGLLIADSPTIARLSSRLSSRLRPQLCCQRRPAPRPADIGMIEKTVD